MPKKFLRMFNHLADNEPAILRTGQNDPPGGKR